VNCTVGHLYPHRGRRRGLFAHIFALPPEMCRERTPEEMEKLLRTRARGPSATGACTLRLVFGSSRKKTARWS